MRTRSFTRMVISGVIAVLTAATMVAPAAAERPGSTGDETDSGYTAAVNVRLSGDGAPGTDGGHYQISVPATCWWAPLDTAGLGWDDVDPADPEAVEEWFTEVLRPYLTGHAQAGRLNWPPVEVFQDAIERAQSGEDIVWYRAQCREGTSAVEEGYHQGVTNYDGGPVAVVNYPFTVNTEPEPAVDPEDLAIEARELLVIDAPEVDRNPKAAALGGGTLVNMPTWFWVTDPAMVGGDGTLTIRADVDGSPVFAEVTASTGGLSIDAPGASSGVCSPQVSQLSWSPDASEDSGCTVEFRRASNGYPLGYPVTASTNWQASWVGQTQDDESVGGDLEPLQRQTVVNVPVAEIQGIVRDIR